MIIRHKYKNILLAGSLSLLALFSCQEELKIEENPNGSKISFQVESDSDFQTRSSATTSTTELDLCGESLNMTLSMYDNADGLAPDAAQTRGAAFDNSEEHQITDISVTSIVSDGNGGKFYFTEDVTISGGRGISDRFWTEAPLSFFAYSVSKDNVTVTPTFKRESGKCNGTFSYTLPATATASPKKDATAQPDVVFAITPDLTRTSDGKVNLTFHHALSAIVFKSGKMPDNVYLNSISIKNVYSSGSCVITPAADRDLTFAWTCSGSQNASYIEEIRAEAEANSQMGGEEAAFMMLPQTMGANTQLVLSFKIDNKEYTLEKKFNELLTKWEADKKYVFTIGLPSDIKVDVEDQVSPDKSVKSELAITNTGTVTTYVRTMLYGEWVTFNDDEEEIVVAMWDMTKDGTFTNFNTTDWLYSETDGFYYYKYPLAVGAEAEDIFGTYELNTVPPVIDSELRLSVVSQAVATEDISLAWGSIVAADTATGELSLK